MKREKQRTYQGKVWESGQDPARSAKAQREVLEYLQKYPEEREFQEECLRKLFGVELKDVDF